MNHQKELIGHEIKIINTEGAIWVNKGSTYLVEGVGNHRNEWFEMKLHGVNDLWNCRRTSFLLEHEWAFLNTNLEAGDEVVLQKDTASFKAGQRTKILEFVDGDKNKIIVEGITPGGWIPKGAVVKAIDFTKWRIKNIYELVRDYGIFNAMNYLTTVMIPSLGLTLDKLSALQLGNGIYINKGAFLIADAYLTGAREWKAFTCFNEYAGVAWNGVSVVGKLQNYDSECDKSLLTLVKEIGKRGVVNAKDGRAKFEGSVFSLMDKPLEKADEKLKVVKQTIEDLPGLAELSPF